MYNKIDGEITLGDGESLDGMIFSILVAIRSVASNGKITVIKDLSEINLDINYSSLSDIALALQRQTLLILDLSASGSYASVLPLPSISNGNNMVYNSGILIALKVDDTAKVYYRFLAQDFTALCTYNGHNQNPLTGWRFSKEAPLIISPTPSQFNNIISNIYIAGDYFFTSDQISSFADAPPGAGAGYLNVVNSKGLKTSDRIYTFTENTQYAKTWKRVSYSNSWVTIPSVNPTAVSDASLRVGDMKITSAGNLAIRINGTTVKEL